MIKKWGIKMTYKTIVIDHAPKAKKIAAEIEDKANEMAEENWELVTFSTVTSGKTILVFRTQSAVPEKAEEIKEQKPVRKSKKAPAAETTGEKA